MPFKRFINSILTGILFGEVYLDIDELKSELIFTVHVVNGSILLDSLWG